jgi:electron transfer flavoprotein alpha subunit
VRIAALVKPIRDVRAAPTAARHAEHGLVVNPFCRRAVAQACELAAAVGDGTVSVVALGPPAAERVLRDAMTAAVETDVSCDGLLVLDDATDPLAIGRALAGALRAAGAFDLVLTGQRGADADGGHLGAQLAARLGLPFVGPARYLSLQRSTLHVRCELDDGWSQVTVELPAVVSCAARLIEPSTRPLAPATDQIVRSVPAPPDGAARRARPISVRPRPPREQVVVDGPPDAQVRRAIELLRARGALHDPADTADAAPADHGGALVAVVTEPARAEDAFDLLGAAARIAGARGGQVVAIGPTGDPTPLGRAGADRVVQLEGSAVAEDVAGAVAGWAADATPTAVLVTSTDWGREVAARVAVTLEGALVAGATRVTRAADGLAVETPVLAGQLVATTHVDARPVVLTVRPGSLPRSRGRDVSRAISSVLPVAAWSRVRVRSRTRTEGLVALDRARAVLGVGLGVDPADYPRLTPLLERLDAALACTRPVADRRWLPSGRQVGLTGRVLTPRLYVTIGSAGAFEHLVGVAGAGTILAVHPAHDAPVFRAADVGIVADWRDVVGPLAAALGP